MVRHTRAHLSNHGASLVFQIFPVLHMPACVLCYWVRSSVAAVTVLEKLFLQVGEINVDGAP
jgi:hypothetical protein